MELEEEGIGNFMLLLICLYSVRMIKVLGYEDSGVGVELLIGFCFVLLSFHLMIEDNAVLNVYMQRIRLREIGEKIWFGYKLSKEEERQDIVLSLATKRDTGRMKSSPLN